MKIFVVMPAYNEEKVIGDVIRAVKKKYKNIVVVDDGSSDKTSQVSRDAGARVLKHVINLGVGGATNTGILYALKKDADVIATVDSDGQHSIDDLEKVIEVIVRGEADICIGSRLLSSQDMPFFKKLGNKALTTITNLISGGKVSDSQSGMKAFKASIFKHLHSDESGYGICSEIVILAEENDLRVKEIPIKVIYTEYSKKKGTTVFTGLRIIKNLIFKRVFER
jgi:glycosyltransferase involved in cell wall biosynthesis